MWKKIYICAFTLGHWMGGSGGTFTEQKHTYIVLTPSNPTFV